MADAKLHSPSLASRLAPLHDAMHHQINAGHVTGVVALVSHGSETHVEVQGTRSSDPADAVGRDTIFRIASLTKPVAAAAAMSLVDDARIALDDPVDRFLPELADIRVLARPDAALNDTVSAHRPVSLRDLLTLRMGFGYILSADADSYPIVQAAREYGLLCGPPQPQSPPAPDEWLRRLASLPLMHQPGDVWMYDVALDVLGVLIARTAGKPLDQVLHQRIFEPLGMSDTGFVVPPEKRHRLATSYEPDPKTGQLNLYDGIEDSQWATPPAFPAAASGLVSTVDDYFAFTRMMMNGGKVQGSRILSEKAIALMTTNQLTPQQRRDASLFLGDSSGWGLGMAVGMGDDGLAISPGNFGWDGGLGTSWRSDPVTGLTGILLTQSSWTSPSPPAVCTDFWKYARGAVQ